MTDKMENWIRAALANHLFEQEKPGDYVVLADSTLRAALEGTRPLQHAEFAALMNSPRTLARFRRLVVARKAESPISAGGIREPDGFRQTAEQGSANAQTSPGALYSTGEAELGYSMEASNDAHWLSRCDLLAGGSHRQVETMHTADRRFLLAVLQDIAGYQLVLRADPAHPEFAALQGKTLQVMDGRGNILMQGVLDDDGELQQQWTFSQPPVSHLLEHGACFGVQLI